MANGAPYDILIVGAGAAGLMATIFAGRNAPPGGRIAALDGAKRVGAKILVSGGGRCNVTHDVVSPDDYAGYTGSSRNQIAKVLRSFSVEQTVAFFRDLGVHLKREDTGKLFPVTDSAKTVLDALLDAVAQTGAEVLTDHRVLSVTRETGHFAVATSQGDLYTRKLVLATGGKSLPKTGSDGQGYEFAKVLGHSVTRTTPALVPLVLEKGHWLTLLSGLSVEVELAVTAGSGKVLHRQRGPMLLTHFGLSGPAAMDISRHWIAAQMDDAAVQLRANFLPGQTFEQVEAELLANTQSRGRSTVVASLGDLLPRRLAEALAVKGAGIDPATPMAQLGKPQRRALVQGLTALPLPVVRDRGYLFAEVTAGGVPLSELDLATMASRTCPGLYLCGEVLDADGRIGGYNFQWAWCTGRLAGRSAAIG
jgi:predicted Rossmann fold flavoprotein